MPLTRNYRAIGLRQALPLGESIPRRRLSKQEKIELKTWQQQQRARRKAAAEKETVAKYRDRSYQQPSSCLTLKGDPSSKD